MRKQKRLVLITGNSRSGTTWLSRILRAKDLDVRHEYVGEHGTVSCFFFMDTPWYPFSPSTHPKGLIAHVGERLRQYEFEHRFHLVRDPLRTIGSIWSTIGREHQRWLEEFGVIDPGIKPKMLKAMHIWYEVNRRCTQATDHRFRLEDLVLGEKAWRAMSRMLSTSIDLPTIPPSNKSRGIFLARRVTMKMMRAADPFLAKSICRMAVAYGYKEYK